MKTLKDKNNKMKNKSGFTIIEVVLVLAIAGLIFLMIFLALPALQRSQRDIQRKNDIVRLSDALVRYKSNFGRYIWERRWVAVGSSGGDGYTSFYNGVNDDIGFRDFQKSYLEQDGEFLDPNGEKYKIYVGVSSKNGRKNSTSIRTVGVDIIAYSRCEGTEFDNNRFYNIQSDASRYSIFYKLESGTTTCLDFGL